MQTTSHLLMIRPVNFGFNAETAVNNAFQKEQKNINIQARALQEFDAFVAVLQKNGIDVTVVEDTASPYTPDSIFPNNWVSFHQDGSLITYPMFALNRRAEKKETVVKTIEDKFSITNRKDLSYYESKGLFLEGTGSMVLDRENKIAYACLSPRTSVEVLHEFCQLQSYRAITFHANDINGKAIYHTNVMMCIADQYAVICLDAITDSNEKQVVKSILEKTGKEIIPITISQMEQFAGNMLQIENDSHEKLLIMSSQAFNSLTPVQVQTLEVYNRILYSPLSTIETNGGGSARCMMAEIFLPQR